nr:MAG TPA: hypothetical protein [Crassvirales sp.]
MLPLTMSVLYIKLNICITLLYKADISSILHCFYKNIIQ